jgi:hypothetical protein
MSKNQKAADDTAVAYYTEVVIVPILHWQRESQSNRPPNKLE